MATTKRTPSKKSTATSGAKKSTPRKSSAKKSSAEKSSSTSAEKSTARKSSSRGSEETSTSKPPRKRASRSSSDAPRAEAGRKPGAVRVAALAAQQLLELTGKDSEGVTGLEREDDGWSVQVEVVEVHRIPNTTDVLALYEVSTDEHGELQSYRRLRRYTRGTPGDE